MDWLLNLGIDYVDIIAYVVIILGTVGVFAKLVPSLKAVKEAVEVLLVAVNAIMDGKVTAEEKKAIRKEVSEFLEAIKKKG